MTTQQTRHLFTEIWSRALFAALIFATTGCKDSRLTPGPLSDSAIPAMKRQCETHGQPTVPVDPVMIDIIRTHRRAFANKKLSGIGCSLGPYSNRLVYLTDSKRPVNVWIVSISMKSKHNRVEMAEAWKATINAILMPTLPKSTRAALTRIEDLTIQMALNGEGDAEYFDSYYYPSIGSYSDRGLYIGARYNGNDDGKAGDRDILLDFVLRLTDQKD